MKRNRIKEWAQIIGFSALILAITLAVAYGALELFVDTSRRILH